MFDRLFDRDRLSGYAGIAFASAIVIIALPFLGAALLLGLILLSLILLAVALWPLGLAAWNIWQQGRHGRRAAAIGAMLLLIAAIVMLAYPAFADPAAPGSQAWVDAVCANNGALLTKIIAWAGSIIGAASLAANARKYIPAPVMVIVDTFALNWVKSESAAAANPPAPQASVK